MDGDEKRLLETISSVGGSVVRIGKKYLRCEKGETEGFGTRIKNTKPVEIKKIQNLYRYINGVS